MYNTLKFINISKAIKDFFNFSQAKYIENRFTYFVYGTDTVCVYVFPGK